MQLSVLTSIFTLLLSSTVQAAPTPVPVPDPQFGGILPGIISALPLVSGGSGGGGAGD